MTLPTDSRREHLKRQWLQQAEAAFELMFDADQQDRLVTFDQRERRACSLTRELATWLIEQHIAEDPSAGRSLTSAAGEVTLRREQWYCPTCRAAFFPSGPQARAGDRRL